jgi:hypothetical protein
MQRRGRPPNTTARMRAPADRIEAASEASRASLTPSIHSQWSGLVIVRQLQKHSR